MTEEKPDEFTEQEWFASQMRGCNNGPNDEPEIHKSADALLCFILRKLGYGKVVDEFEKLPKWYE